MNSPTFRVFWLRESGCDAGAVRGADEIDPLIRDQVMALTGGEGGEFTLRLPYMDRYEWKRRSKILKALQYERDGRLIRAVLDTSAATRDLAATLVFTDPAWKNSPSEREPEFHDAWHRVSTAVQRKLKDSIGEEYFRDLSRLEKRDSAYTMVVYQSSRVFSSKIRHQYTYDLRDYPECRPALGASTMQIGARVERVLERLQRRLIEVRRPELARRYTPAWHQDVVNAVRRKPRRFLDLLMREAEVVNAIVDLGTERTALSVHSCSRRISLVLRCVHGMDLRKLGPTLLETATQALTQSSERGGDDVLDGGFDEDGDVIASRRPDSGIRGEEDGDNGHAGSGGQMTDPGVVANVQAGSGKPTSQLV